MTTDFETLSKNNIKEAKEIIEKLKIIEICDEFNCTTNLVGSVATDLLMDKLDIDFHIYPSDFCVSKIYTLIGKLAEKTEVTETSCGNFLNTEYKSLDWHLSYQSEQNKNWKIDMIFIRADSPYVGKAEKIVETIKQNITEAQKKTILRIKLDGYQQLINYKGIEIYKAVIEKNVKTIEEFIA